MNTWEATRLALNQAKVLLLDGRFLDSPATLALMETAAHAQHAKLAAVVMPLLKKAVMDEDGSCRTDEHWCAFCECIYDSDAMKHDEGCLFLEVSALVADWEKESNG